MCYDNVNKELIHADNIRFANLVSFTSGTVTQPSINFLTLNTGLFSSYANSLNFTTAGVQRLDLTSTRIASSIPTQLPSGAQGTPSIYFTESNSGLYRPGLNNIGISTNRTLKFNVGKSVITSALGLALPTSGETSSILDYYEETTFASTWTYGNTTIASITMSIIRIGKQTKLYVPISVTQTNTNGSSANVTINTSFSSRFCPNAQINLPFYLNNGGTIGLHSITIFTDGNSTISKNSGVGFSNNTSVFFVANDLSWIN